MSARINSGHPLARGLAGVWALNERGGNVAFNAAGTKQNDALFVSTPTWTSDGINFAAGPYLDCGSIPALNGATNASLVGAGNIQSSTTLWLSGRAPAVPGSLFPHVQLLHHSDGKTYFVVDAASASARGGVIYSGTGDHVFGLSYDGTQSADATKLKGYIDGIGQALDFTGGAASVPTSIPSSSSTWQIGADVPSSRYQTGATYWVILWIGRTLSADEQAYIGGDLNAIWRMFQPAQGAWLMPGMTTTGMLTYGGRSTNSPQSRPINGPAIPLVYG